jgi:glucokinase
VAADLYLGADTGGTGVKYVITDRTGQVVHKSEVKTDPSSAKRTVARLAIDVAGVIAPSADSGESTFSRLAGVGMACAGIVDPVSGSLGRSPNLSGWEDTNLIKVLANEFHDIPIVVANDVNAGLYGEFKAGAGQGHQNLVMIALGTGVGGGVLVGGQLVIGSHNGAGEIGHMVLDPSGPVCTCGGVGCLEAWAGSVAIVKQARLLARVELKETELSQLVAEKGDDLSVLDLSRLAENGDAASLALFAEVGQRLGHAIGNLVNILDPDLVIIGGGVAQAGELILRHCRAVVPGLVLAAAAKNVPIVPAELGPQAAAVGAAWLAREKQVAV